MSTRNAVAELMEYARILDSEVTFEDMGSEGPDHQKIFTQRVVCNGEVYPNGVGRSKKQAKANAADQALIHLSRDQRSRQSVDDNSFEEANFIGILNQYCQEKHLTPNYFQVKRDGPPHSLQFTYEVVINGRAYPVGEGKTVKQAKQNAAQQAWSALQDWDSKVSISSSVSEDDAPPMMSSTSTSTWSSTSLDLTNLSSEMEAMSTSDSIEFAASGNPLNDQAAVENKGIGGSASNKSTKSRFTSEFDSIKYLGGGGFGDVFKAREIMMNKKYAVKIVSCKEKAPLREVMALSDLLHNNIVRYYSCWMEDTGYKQHTSVDNRSSSGKSPTQFLYIKMELCDSETLQHWIQRKNAEPRNNTTTTRRRESLTIAQQIVGGIEHIHSNRLIHRDLKPANIMFGQDGAVKIGDFGLVTADDVNDETPMDRTNDMGTLSYMAPEQHENIYDRKVDIFAFGLIYFELLWILPTGHERVVVLRDARNQMLPREFQHKFYEENKMMKLMLCREPKQRAEASELKAELGKLAHTLNPQTKPQKNVTV